MKIAFLGNFGVSFSSENHHKLSLEALGHTVIPLQEGRAFSGDVLGEALAADVFVWVHTHGWPTPGAPMASVLDELKRNGIPTVTYHLDLWLGLARQKDLETDSFYRHIGHFFTVDKLMAEWFNENSDVKGCYLPAGVFHEEAYMAEPQRAPVPPIDAPLADGQAHIQYEQDLVFVGSRGYHREWPYRPRLIDWLKSTYGERFQHFGGDGLGVVRGDALNRLYADTRIAIGDTLCVGFNYPHYFSDRLFESTGRGAFTIFPYIKGLEDYFEIDREIVTYEFDNFADLRRKIDYYLIHDEEREAIRRAGHERTRRDHTYKSRWEVILATVGPS